MSYGRLLVALPVLCAVLSAERGLGEDLTAGLSAKRLSEIEDAVDRGLRWMASQQNADGSFSDNTRPASHPTAYALMALLSRGHQPGRGQYGRVMSKTIDFLMSTQRLDGSFSTQPPERPPRTYTHALTGLVLSEAYGGMSSAQSASVGGAIERALAYSRKNQVNPKVDPDYEGGWMQGDSNQGWSCSPSTCWELAFMRSASNAGFEVPQEWIDEGIGFIEKCYEPGPAIVATRKVPVGLGHGVFRYYPKAPPGRQLWANFNTTSAGMLSLQLNGRREDPRVQKAAAWLADTPIPFQNSIPRFYFGCYMTSQAMAQAGGDNWNRYFPRLVDRLMEHQAPEGYWRLDGYIGWGNENTLGPNYYTALAVLCLTLPDQLLPIHQR